MLSPVGVDRVENIALYNTLVEGECLHLPVTGYKARRGDSQRRNEITGLVRVMLVWTA